MCFNMVHRERVSLANIAVADRGTMPHLKVPYYFYSMQFFADRRAVDDPRMSVVTLSLKGDGERRREFSCSFLGGVGEFGPPVGLSSPPPPPPFNLENPLSATEQFYLNNCDTSFRQTNQWGIQGGTRDARPPSWSKFSYFHAVFWEKNFAK